MPTVYGWDLTFQPASGSGVPSGVTVYGWAGLGVPYTAAPAAILYAQRAGSGGVALQDAATLTTYTDSGSPDYAYDGTGGSDELLAESWVAEHDEVGDPQLWNVVTNTAAGTRVGMPSVERLNGLDSMDASNGVTGIADFTGCEAILIEYTHVASSIWYALRADTVPNDGWILGFRTNLGGRLLFQTYVSGVVTSISQLAGVTNGTRWAALLSRTAPGTYDIATFAMDGTVVRSAPGVSAPDTGPGVLDTSFSVSSVGNTIHRVRGWTSPQTAADITAVLDGTTTSGWAADLPGLASGCYRAAAPTELPIQTASGTGAPTAEY